MPILRSAFIGIIGVMAVIALVILWGSWSLDELATFMAPIRDGVNSRPKFVCNTHLASNAIKDTVGWRCDALNVVCDYVVQSACSRVAIYKPGTKILAPSPSLSQFPDPAFANSLLFHRLTPEKKDGTPLAIRRKIYGGTIINDIPHSSLEQFTPGQVNIPPEAPKPKGAVGTGQ
jgi:hypothetical protein